jgi:hypothetical protein
MSRLSVIQMTFEQRGHTHGFASPTDRPIADRMSSGPFTYALSAAAAFTIRSLLERPDLQTADEIASGRDAHGEIDAAHARDGLQELARHGLAEQDADGRWSLTDAGREAAARQA